MALPATALLPQNGSIVGRWKLNEASGSRVDDVGSSDLTDNNTVGSAAGQFDETCADFEKDNSEYLSVADNAALSITSDISISAWVKIESAPGTDEGRYIVAKTDVSTNRSYSFYYRDLGGNKGISFIYSSSGGAGSNLYTGFCTQTLTPGTWYHLAVTVDVSTQTCLFYVDGTQKVDESTDSDTPGSIYDGTAAFEIGRVGSGSGYFDGLIQDVVIWGGVILSSAEITNMIAVYTPPATPTGLAASVSDGSTTIGLTWTDNADDENEYYVERSDDGSTGWTEIGGAQPANTTSYNDALGTKSTQKYYRVRCKRTSDGVYSSYSGTVNATTAPADPSAPAVSSNDDSNTLDLSWTDNSSDETGFEIQQSPNGTDTWTAVTTTAANATSYAHDVGARDTQKYYRIRAVGADANSNWTSVVNAITAPANPTSIVLTPSSGQIEVAWTDNSSTETTFSIERKPSGGAYSVLTTDTASPYADTSGAEGTTYFYKIRAYRASDGIYSGYATEQSSTVPPSAPTNLLASCTDDTPAASKVQLTWQHTSQNETGTKIERKLGAGAYSTITTTAGGVSSYEDTGLTESSEYTYRISATAGGVFSSTIEATVTTLLGISSSLRHTFYRKINHLPY